MRVGKKSHADGLKSARMPLVYGRELSVGPETPIENSTCLTWKVSALTAVLPSLAGSVQLGTLAPRFSTVTSLLTDYQH